MIVVSAFLLALVGLAPAQASPAYVRWPDLHGNRIVFCAEGDLWVVADSGGIARRLTNHVGNEFYPHWSPTGSGSRSPGTTTGTPTSI
jgi:tricorn protease